MTRVETLRSRVALLPVDNIDTDQIIPARFLKVIDKNGLADCLFADWRKTGDFVLNRPEVKGAGILVAGENFGCGSSREHAPWALVAFGFRAIIAKSFADIFQNNALKNGLLPVAVPPDFHDKVLAACRTSPSCEVSIDLATQVVSLPDGQSASFAVDPFAKHCLLRGVDQLGYLLGLDDKISAFESRSAALRGNASSSRGSETVN